MNVTKNININRAIEISLVSSTPILIVSEPKYLQDVDRLTKELYFVNFATPSNYLEAIKVDYHFAKGELSQLETWQNVFDRVSEAKKLQVKNTEIDYTSKSLLDNAINRLELNEAQVSSIKKIALDIAKLDKSETIQVQHIAEAIQYHCVDLKEFTQSIKLEIQYLENKLKELLG